MHQTDPTVAPETDRTTRPGSLGTSMLQTAWERAVSLEAFAATAEQLPQLWRDMIARARAPEDLVIRARALPSSRRLLVLLEDWCGDAVNTIPVLANLAGAAPTLELRVLRRDENLALMDAHLSPTGARAIPVVIVLNADFSERGWWGSRPAEIQRWAMSPAARALPSADRYREVRRWYARDRGRTACSELLHLLERTTGSATRAA